MYKATGCGGQTTNEMLIAGFVSNPLKRRRQVANPESLRMPPLRTVAISFPALPAMTLAGLQIPGLLPLLV